MLLPLLLSTAAPPALAGEGSLAQTWEDPPPATWIIALETGGDNRTLAEAAREPLAQLVEVLPAGDRVEILVVHTRPSMILDTRTIDDAGRTALVSEIRTLAVPSAKATDLGAGLQSIAARIDAADGDGPRIVLLMSSFCHDPPLGSEWADGGFGCRAIRGFERLDRAFDEVAGHENVAVTLFPAAVPQASPEPESLQRTEQYFQPAAAVRVEARSFADWVAATRTDLQSERVAPLARAEAGNFRLTAAQTRAPTSEEPTAVVTLGTGLVHLGFDATTVQIEGARTEATTLRLAPSGSIDLEVDVPEPPFSFLPASDTVKLPVHITLTGDLTPKEGLAQAGITSARGPVTVDMVLTAERHYGLSPLRSAGMFASVLLLAGAVTLVALRRLAPLRLGGTFAYRHQGGERHQLKIEHLSEAPIVIGADGRLTLGRREDAVLVLRVERPLWRTSASAEIRAPGLEINAHPTAPGRHVVIAGATSFLFGDYRLSWE